MSLPQHGPWLAPSLTIASKSCMTETHFARRTIMWCALSCENGSKQNYHSVHAFPPLRQLALFPLENMFCLSNSRVYGCKSEYKRDPPLLLQWSLLCPRNNGSKRSHLAALVSPTWVIGNVSNVIFNTCSRRHASYVHSVRTGLAQCKL